MDLKELQSFFMVAHLRSGTKAAKALNIGQPTVTKHLRRLEDELGKELFVRSSRPMELTATGMELLRLARPLVEGILGIAAGPSNGATEDTVSLACTHGFMTSLLVQAVKSFRSRNPHRKVRIRLGTKPEVLEMVFAGKVDFGIAPSPDQLNSLSFLPLVASERVLLTPSKHPLLDRPLKSLDEIAAHPLILLGYRTHTRVLLENAFREMNVAYEIAVELDSMDMVKKYVELDIGIGVGHRIALDPSDARTLGIISLSKFLPTELVGVIMPRERALSKIANEFVQVIKATAKGAEAEWGEQRGKKSRAS